MEEFLRRGNLMWEGSRMMLHEHREALEKYHEEKLKQPPPDPSPEDLSEMGAAAMDSLQYEMDVIVTYWKEGFYYEVPGIIDRVDQARREIKFEGEWIPFHHLRWIERKDV
ncbi:YolD-like family protein [Alkalicoccus halolimnae]|uniref:YolD-like family protein n=1 Tax=Alkalicoccus halolimnae TaxID=1667239 RepID=A0A5C7FC71_9BACI|nr:YolD-like family protein [Alkalicoccus halolimnae]TXF84628.1 YolD-like family protein [Alkalicoccus halolimnae]